MFKQCSPAPLPADGLAAALAPFGQSRMLPREAYVDPAVFKWEQHNIFSGWTCVGHASDLAAVGAQKAVGTGPNAILLVRGEDTIRAFAAQGVTHIVECGPGKVLAGLVRRIDDTLIAFSLGDRPEFDEALAAARGG